MQRDLQSASDSELLAQFAKGGDGRARDDRHSIGVDVQSDVRWPHSLAVLEEALAASARHLS